MATNEEINEKKLSRKDIALVVTTIVMVLVLIAGYIYDMNSLLLKRTIGLNLDENMKIEEMDKQGMLFYRVSYQSKIKIPADKVDNYIMLLTGYFGVEGNLIPYDEYKERVEGEIFDELMMKPNPSDRYAIWLQGFKTEEDHEVIIIVDIEGETEDSEEAFIYIYYSK